jgi:flagellar secretion chaperone FliS
MIPKNATYAYREAAIRGASQIRLVIIMYDMVLDDMQRALQAIRVNDIEQRTAETRHVLAVLEQLQGTLDMVSGGDAAVAMDRLYSIVRGKLLEANMKNSAQILQELIDMFSDLKAAWQKVEGRQSEEGLARQYADAAPFGVAPALTESAGCDWSA